MMNGIAGSCRWDAIDAEPECLRRPVIMEAARLSGLIMHCGGKSPATSVAGNLCCWDGRLDNRRELLEGWAAPQPRGASDAAVALAVWERHGIRGLSRIVGDFSLAIWDAVSRSVILARDFAGVRPLYCYHSGNVLIWASSLDWLTHHVFSDDLDERYLAALMAGIPAPALTPYRQIRSVRPGCALSISEKGLTESELWRPPINSTLCWKDESEYADRLLDLFEDAVRTRLESTPVVAAELSGGLDSSSVVCMVDRLLMADGVPGKRLTVFSYHHPGTADEKFIRAVHEGRQHTAVDLQLNDRSFASQRCVGKSAPHWWQPRLEEVGQAMRRAGAQTLLTGQLGDLIMSNWADDSEQVADRIAEHRYSDAVQQAISWSRSLERPVYSILWNAMRVVVRRSSGTADETGRAGQAGCMSSLTAKHQRWLYEWNEHRQVSVPGREIRPSRRKRIRALTDVIDAGSLHCPETLQELGLNLTHPFAHRPLVEFMLCVPSEIACGPGAPRRLMRSAFAKILPPQVATRKSKTAYTRIILGAIRRLALGLAPDVDNMRLVQRGIVERASVERRLARLVNRVGYDDPHLRQILLIEFWLRWREECSASPSCAGETQRRATTVWNSSETFVTPCA